MQSRSAIGSWLEGPPRAPGGGYPGQRLALPEHGPGSVARPGRRLVGVALDWGLAMMVSTAFAGGDPWVTLAYFAVMHVVLVGTAGTSIGHQVTGLGVRTVDGALPGPVRALVRTALLCLAVPPLVWDRDQRGLHDKAARTVLVRL